MSSIGNRYSIIQNVALALTMTFLILAGFATTGALLMKRNGLSWVEGALWGGFLTIFGIIIVLFKIRSSKKKSTQISANVVDQMPDLENDEKIQLGIFLDQQITKQILFGIAWWVGSAVAMYVALQSTGNTVYWFGGALGALFHWYRAYKLIEVGKKENISVLKQNTYIVIAVCILVAAASFTKIVPEYFRIDAPTVGTCWAEAESGMYAPVACWGGNAKVKAISLADSAEACGTSTYFEPSTRESRYTCLEDL